MKHAYCIMAHNEFQLLETLINCLDYPGNSIFVHIDKRASIDELKNIHMREATLKIVQEINVFWGGASQIQCELFLFDIAVKNCDADYFHLLSGQDLPIKKQCYIHDFFDKHAGFEFIAFRSFSPVYDHLLDRVKYYHFLPFGKRGYDIRFDSKMTTIQKKIGIKRNSDIKFYKGANWCSVTRRFVEMLLNNKSYIKKVFLHTLCADEIYKQTLYMMNRDKYGFKRYLGEEANEDHAIMRKIDWQRGFPYVWRSCDYDELIQSDFLFARKFSSVTDKDIINLISKRVLCD